MHSKEKESYIANNL
jgi:hypothetical protein